MSSQLSGSSLLTCPPNSGTVLELVSWVVKRPLSFVHSKRERGSHNNELVPQS